MTLKFAGTPNADEAGVAVPRAKGIRAGSFPRRTAVPASFFKKQKNGGDDTMVTLLIIIVFIIVLLAFSKVFAIISAIGIGLYLLYFLFLGLVALSVVAAIVVIVTSVISFIIRYYKNRHIPDDLMFADVETLSYFLKTIDDATIQRYRSKYLFPVSTDSVITQQAAIVIAFNSLCRIDDQGLYYRGKRNNDCKKLKKLRGEYQKAMASSFDKHLVDDFHRGMEVIDWAIPMAYKVIKEKEKDAD